MRHFVPAVIDSHGPRFFPRRSTNQGRESKRDNGHPHRRTPPHSARIRLIVGAGRSPRCRYRAPKDFRIAAQFSEKVLRTPRSHYIYRSQVTNRRLRLAAEACSTRAKDDAIWSLPFGHQSECRGDHIDHQTTKNVASADAVLITYHTSAADILPSSSISFLSPRQSPPH